MTVDPVCNVAVQIVGDAASLHLRGRDLADRLKLPIIDANDRGDRECAILLVVSEDGVGLRAYDDRCGRVIRADFADIAYSGGGRGGGRGRVFSVRTVALGGGRSQPLARAVGVSGGDGGPLRVIDATAGLGGDAFRLACFGCHVTAIERSPIVAAMLEDAVERASRIPQLADILERFEIHCGDARQLLTTRNAPVAPDVEGSSCNVHDCDVVYLDPMFPARRKASAAVRKEMTLFRQLVGEDPDSDDLFDAARKVARKRVVVKRLPEAPTLGGKCDFTIASKLVRYDVYMSQ